MITTRVSIYIPPSYQCMRMYGQVSHTFALAFQREGGTGRAPPAVAWVRVHCHPGIAGGGGDTIQGAGDPQTPKTGQAERGKKKREWESSGTIHSSSSTTTTTTSNNSGQRDIGVYIRYVYVQAEATVQRRCILSLVLSFSLSLFLSLSLSLSLSLRTQPPIALRLLFCYHHHRRRRRRRRRRHHPPPPLPPLFRFETAAAAAHTAVAGLGPTQRREYCLCSQKRTGIQLERARLNGGAERRSIPYRIRSRRISTLSLFPFVHFSRQRERGLEKKISRHQA